jgi:hypothetical protein
MLFAAGVAALTAKAKQATTNLFIACSEVKVILP